MKEAAEHKEYIPVKCPYCKEEMKAGDSCAKCGDKTLTSKGMKVEFKDFKGAELLDIQMTRNGPAGPSVRKPGDSQKTVKSGAAPRKVAGSGKAVPVPKKPSAKKTFLIAASAVLILAAIAGFYLLRYLGKY